MRSVETVSVPVEKLVSALPTAVAPVSTAQLPELGPVPTINDPSAGVRPAIAAKSASYPCTSTPISKPKF